MCTSIVLRTKNGFDLLARTFDFNDNLTEALYVVPRRYPVPFSSDGNLVMTKYAFLGSGTTQNKIERFYDGINEKGLICASLYLENTKANEKRGNQLNIPISTFTTWVLSQFATVDELIQALPKVNIIYDQLLEGEEFYPLHWIVKDKTRAIIIEKEANLVFYEADLGVLANTPNYICQCHNLKRYCRLTPQNENLGLPGDTSSPSRFVRAFYLKKQIPQPQTEVDGVTTAFKILDSVAIQKGLDYDSPEEMSYSHITTCLCCQTLKYYCYTYDNQRIQVFSLLHEDLNANRIKQYSFHRQQSFDIRN